MESRPMLESLSIRCPWCGERFEAVVDGSGGDCAYTEDCPVCCRPIALRLATDGDGHARGLAGERED
jgi:hypothetical protein